MTSGTKRARRKPKFCVGQVVWCNECKHYERITRTFWDKRMDYLFYGLGSEDPSKEGSGHSDVELRPLTKREAGR